MARNTTALDRLKQLEQERNQLLDEAKAEALKNAREAVDALNELGFNYRLVEGGRRGASGSRKGTRTLKPGTVCSICGFATEPPHDARAHRAQGDKKKPFTATQLKERGLTRV